MDLWDDESWDVLCDRHVQLAREAGALTVLPLALNQRIGVHAFAGELAAAASLIEEMRGGHRGDRQAASRPTVACCSPPGGAARRRPRELIEASVNGGGGPGRGARTGRRPVGARGALQRPRPLRGRAGRGRAGQRASARIWRSSTGALVELIEAAVRSGKPERAADALGGCRR